MSDYYHYLTYTATSPTKANWENSAQIDLRKKINVHNRFSDKLSIWATCRLQEQKFGTIFVSTCKCHWSICKKIAKMALVGVVVL